jgi:hypothetical protein
MQLAHIRGEPLYQIFLDLSKAYDTMDRDCTIRILRAYGVGDRVLQILTNFWDSLTVVARQQGYYGQPFKAERGTTQGDIVSPTIFNIIVDAVVREWYVRLDTENLSDKVQAIFYADDGHLYGTDADALQRATDIIVELFQRIRLQANPTKTKAMVCAPPPSVTRISSPAYKRRTSDRTAQTYRERIKQQVECDICGTSVQAQNMQQHKKIKHGIDLSLTQQATPPHLSTADGNTYTISMPHFKDTAQCFVLGCEAIIKTRYNMRCHFMHRHFQDTIIIMEEGTLPRCTLCGMFVTPLQLAGRHTESVLCKRGAKRNKQRMQDLQCIGAFRRTFTIQNQPIETLTSFRYLGRIIASSDSDWEAAKFNLHKARTRWMNISRLLARTSASPQISSLFYKATVQTVLLYGSETWVINREILQLLLSFHHSIARRLTGRFPRPIPGTDEWTHPSIQETLQRAGLFQIEEYLRRRRTYLERHAQQLQILQECQQALQVY